MALLLVRIRGRVESRRPDLRHAVPFIVGVVASTGFFLAVMHGIEATIWATAYLWLGALDSPLEAILYSVDSMSTRGASGLMLHPQWRMMGALESVDGMLLFGISTAYIFSVMQSYWPMISDRD